MLQRNCTSTLLGVDRDKNRKSGELWVPVEVFDMKLNQFEPMSNFKEFMTRLVIKN